MRHLFIFTVTLFLLTSIIQVNGQNKGYKILEEVKKDDGNFTIPYKKYQLDNGMIVIIHEDKSDPLVHVDVSYHVGSSREEVGKSGFAHFFEHMMFQGSEHIKDEEHFKIITESGGDLNGGTSRDMTNYYETVPVNQLETVLWLESDRMGYFLDAVTQKKFEVQRATVKNEKGERIYNSPYGELWLLNDRALYPYGHPYSWPTIGEIEDLNRVDVNDLKNFFIRWYGPNNVTLTIGGQVDADKVMPLVVKYFGDIKRGIEVEKIKLDPPKLKKNRYVSYEDKNIELPAISMGWPTVPSFHPDEAALDCLSDILGEGKNSPLYKALVKSNKAIENYSFNDTSELAGEYMLLSIVYPNTPLSEIEDIVNKVLNDFGKKGVTDEDLIKYKASFESNFVNTLETVEGKVTQLAQYQVFLNNPNYNNDYVNSRLNLTKEDVMRVYNKYIKDKPSVVISVIPKGSKIKTVKPDNYEIPMSGKSNYPTVDYSKMQQVKNESSIDRSVRPTPPINPLVEIPDFWEDSVNDIKVMGIETTEIPVITFNMRINGGATLDKMGKYGTASLLADMMMEGTKDMTVEELSDEMLKLGASISFGAGQNSINLYVTSLKKNFDKTLALVEKMLYTPRFEQESLDKIKLQTLEAIKNSLQSVSSLASLGFQKVSFDKNDRRRLPSYGDSKSIKSITMEDIKTFYNKNISPDVSSIVVVGDINKDKFLQSISFLKKWKSKKVVIPTYKNTVHHNKPVVYIVDKPDAAQSQFMFGYVTDLKYDPVGKYFSSVMMNFPIAGNFNSRLNLNLREDKGYTYGAFGRFRNSRSYVSWVFSTSVKADKTIPALKEVIKEFKQYREKGVTDEELAFTKSAISQSDAMKYESFRAKLGFIRRILEYHLDKNYTKQQAKIIQSMTKENINKLIKEYIDMDKMAFVIAGDKSKLKNAIKKEGLEVKVISVDL